MNNKEYSTPTIIFVSLDEADIITTSIGTETPMIEFKELEWEW